MTKSVKPRKKSSNLPIVFFYVFIGMLVLFFVIITLKIALSPICTTEAQHTCVIDTWSIAGLTAAVFGIAATLLTFLAAFAVAYWWANLDERVETRTTELIEQGLQQQEVQFQAQIAENVKAFEEQITQLKGSLQLTEKEMIIAVTTSLDPWNIESWASELLAVAPLSEVAIRMVLSYLKEVDALLPNPVPHPRRKTLYFAPSDDPLYYWTKVLAWQEKVKDQNIQSYIDTAERQVDLRRPKIEEYKTQAAKRP